MTNRVMIVDEWARPNPKVVKRVGTIKQAEAYIAEVLEPKDPGGVEKGRYGIDGDEGLKRGQKWYFFEVTDTFGGEANYCWVRRYKVAACTMVGALRKVSRHEGFSNNLRINYGGEPVRWDVKGAAICIFGEVWEEQSHVHNLNVKEL